MQALVSDIAEIRQQVGEQQRRLAALETHLRQMRLESQARYAESHRVDL
jgi:hypothetical protein